MRENAPTAKHLVLVERAQSTQKMFMVLLNIIKPGLVVRTFASHGAAAEHVGKYPKEVAALMMNIGTSSEPDAFRLIENAVKLNAQGHSFPILAMSANDAHKSRALEIGADHFVYLGGKNFIGSIRPGIETALKQV
ncbi:hypothetical protein HY994_06090 [Candidatus Micrarchaeota archaeon]|nr:hypothetical protein [Candidatus Micrarchaeota archaeon]